MKYRIWDKRTNEYTNGYVYFVTQHGKVMGDYDIDYSGETQCDYVNWEKINQEDFIVELSTGLKDKNGVEIYENDRVYLSEIDKRGTLTIDVSVTMQLWFTSDDGYYHIDFGHFDTTNIEVIGNIHDE